MVLTKAFGKEKKERKKEKKRKETVTADEWTELSEKAELISAVYCVFNKWREKKEVGFKVSFELCGRGGPTGHDMNIYYVPFSG